jgi:hypothetical protein
MRKVFTSPRLENVEAVATLLRDAGIEVKITEPRSYRGSRRSSFTYRESEDEAPLPAVWIVRADDQPRGRQLLREAGLLDSARGESSYLPLSVLERDKEAQAAGKRSRAMRIKLGLLAAIVAVIGLMVFTARKPDATTATATAVPPVKNPMPTIVPQSADELASYRVDVPSALAKLLVEEKLAARAPEQACIAIDGKDPPPQFMQALQPVVGTAVFAASQCPGEAAWDINVHDYMTDGSGSGSVQLMLDLDDAQTLDVEREGDRWRVLRVR